MAQRRPAIAPHGFPSAAARYPRRRLNPRRFGRGHVRVLEEPQEKQKAWRVSDDVKLFAGTFAAGFVFVAIMVA